MNKLFLLPILFLGLLLSGCSGGGSTPVNTAPNASNVSVVDSNGGTADMGDTLTGVYTYTDADVESGSTFRWLRNDVEISGETSLTYNLLANDALKNITFEVTPRATTGVTDGSAAISTSISIAAIPKPLNDTGITLCADYAYTDSGTNYDVTGSSNHNNDLDCSTQSTVPTFTSDGFDADGDVIRAGQDALIGRDATDNDNNDGYAGHSFTKLDESGGDLLADAASWSCVRDNVTGLVWEKKMPYSSGELRSSSYTYTWYSLDTSNNGGDHGIGDTGTSTTTNFESDPATPIIGSNNCLDDARCDTEKYVADVNASNSGNGLCGATDWRLPNREELLSIVSYEVDPFIDINYFPSVKNYYWSSSANPQSNTFAFNVAINGVIGYNGEKSIARYIRLVRNSN